MDYLLKLHSAPTNKSSTNSLQRPFTRAVRIMCNHHCRQQIERVLETAAGTPGVICTAELRTGQHQVEAGTFTGHLRTTQLNNNYTVRRIDCTAKEEPAICAEFRFHNFLAAPEGSF